MKTKELHERLKQSQTARGFYFNRDEAITMDLVEGLAVNMERYGYMACPCRLATGQKAEDKDIICPCDYRDADVEEFGACYCGLYVSRENNENGITDINVPERRPIMKLPY